MIIDSHLSVSEALIQNPKQVAPDVLMSKQVLLTVQYWGYDGQIHGGQIIVHELVGADVQQFFDAAYAQHFPIEKVIPISQYDWDDERSCTDNNSSAYSYRTIMGTTRVSKHGLGTAFDINPAQNIYIKFDANLVETYRLPADGIYDTESKGTLYTEHPLVLLMKSLGWTWGGDWTPDSGRIDYQHFEKIPPELAHYLE